MRRRRSTLDRLAVEADPLAQVGQVRGGDQPGAQAERAQQRLDHARGRGLAVGPGHVDHRVGALRVAEELRESPDPVKGRGDLRLGPARLELAAHLAEAVQRVSGVAVTGPSSHPRSGATSSGPGASASVGLPDRREATMTRTITEPIQRHRPARPRRPRAPRWLPRSRGPWQSSGLERRGRRGPGPGVVEPGPTRVRAAERSLRARSTWASRDPARGAPRPVRPRRPACAGRCWSTPDST